MTDQSSERPVENHKNIIVKIKAADTAQALLQNRSTLLPYCTSVIRPSPPALSNCTPPDFSHICCVAQGMASVFPSAGTLQYISATIGCIDLKFVETFTVPRRCIPMTLVILTSPRAPQHSYLWFLSEMSQQLLEGLPWNLVRNSCPPLDELFCDPLILHLVPSLGQCFNLFMKKYLKLLTSHQAQLCCVFRANSNMLGC